jgi:hypothetical protein
VSLGIGATVIPVTRDVIIGLTIAAVAFAGASGTRKAREHPDR